MISFGRSADPIEVWARFFVDGVLTNPDSAVVTIYNELDTKVVDGVAMSKSADGVYYYNYNPASDAVLGDYLVKVEFTLASETTPEYATFLLES